MNQICVSCSNTISYDKNTPDINCVKCEGTIHKECAFICIKCGKYMCDKCAIATKGICCNKDLKDVDTNMEFVSSTMFESFKNCSHNFLHEYILKTIPESMRENKYSAIGTMLHDLFEKYSLIRPLTGTDFCNIIDETDYWFNNYNGDLFENELDKDEFRQKALTTSKNFYDNELTMHKPFQVEQQQFIDLGEDLPTIRVTIDRIQKEDDEFIVWDYKTGKVYTGSKLKDNLQLPIYAMAVKHLHGKYPKSLILHFPQHDNTLREFKHLGDGTYECKVPRGGTYTFTVSEKMEEMKEIWKDIKAKRFKGNTKNKYFCINFCNLGKTNQCDYLKGVK